jgi:hypothetical protein
MPVLDRKKKKNLASHRVQSLTWLSTSIDTIAHKQAKTTGTNQHMR